MTIREASKKFNLEEKEIRNRQRNDMIPGIYKEDKNIVIPDNTEIIPSKKEIQSFLLQILKYRNNNNIVISRKLCPDQPTLEALMRYLYKRGFIGKYDESNTEHDLISKVQLTEEGIEYVLGKNNYITINNTITIPLTVNIACINI